MNQYDKDRAAAKALYASGQMSYKAYKLELCLIDCEEREDPRACVECQRKACAKTKRKVGRNTKGKK